MLQILSFIWLTVKAIGAGILLLLLLGVLLVLVGLPALYSSEGK